MLKLMGGGGLGAAEDGGPATRGLYSSHLDCLDMIATILYTFCVIYL